MPRSVGRNHENGRVVASVGKGLEPSGLDPYDLHNGLGFYPGSRPLSKKRIRPTSMATWKQKTAVDGNGSPWRPHMSNDDRKRRGESGPGTAIITKTKPQTKRPSMY